MSLSLDPTSADLPRRLSIPERAGALSALLLAEAIFFTMRFDTPKSVLWMAGWADAFSDVRLAIQFALVSLAAAALLGGSRLAIRLRREFELAEAGDAGWSLRLAAHAVALVGFTRLSMFVCEGDLTGSAHPRAWFLAWAGAGLATGLTWLAALVRPSAWPGLALRCRGELMIGAAVGAGAIFAGGQTSLRGEFLAGPTLTFASRLLGLVSAGVASDPATMMIELDGFRVVIAPACSGSEGIGLVWTFLAAYLWWSRRSLRWPRALLLLPLGTAAIWLANALRIAGLVLIGARWSPAVALGGFHSQAGWLGFLAVSLGLVAASRRSAYFAAGSRQAPADEGEAIRWANPTAAYLAPLLAIVATTMFTGAFSSGFDALYGLRIATAGSALWYFRRELAGLGWSASWFGVAVGVAAFGLWMALEPASGEGARSLASGLASLPPGWARAWIVARVVGSVAVVPLAEELAFRGYLARRLISADFESVPMNRLHIASLAISSAAFGLLHGRWLAGGLVGLLYAAAMYRRGKLGDAVVAHAVTNALIAGVVLLSGDLSLWA